jgi:hypothetical protein
VCGSDTSCYPCFMTLGLYSPYTHNPNGYYVCQKNSKI